MKREKKKSAGPLAGILMIVIGIFILWKNEGNDVKNIKTIEEARNVLVNVSSDKVDSANEGKLVSTNGKLEIGDEYLVDSTFGLQSPKTAKLVRKVEMFQWIEEEHEDDEGYVTYTYKKEWKSTLVDSSSFSDSTKVNPTSMPYEEEVFYANTVSLGAFTISDAQKALLDTKAVVTLGDTISIPAGYYKVNNYISSVENLGNANVGDVRISFVYNNDKEISILAKQSGSSFLPYESEQGKTLFRVESGVMTGDDIINVVEKENNILKWVLRILGVFLNMAGFAALLSPIAFLVKWIPLLGNGIAKFIGWIGCLVGLIVSFIVIAIAWLFFRPLVAILMFVGVGGAIFLIVKLIKKSKAVEAPVQPGTEQSQVMQQPVMQQPMMQLQPQVVQQPMMSQQPQMMSQQSVVQQPQVVQQQPMMGQPIQQPMMQPQPQVVQQPVVQPQQDVNPLEQQQIQAAQNAAYEQQVAAQQPQQDPLSIFGQNNQQ